MTMTSYFYKKNLEFIDCYNFAFFKFIGQYIFRAQQDPIFGAFFLTSNFCNYFKDLNRNNLSNEILNFLLVTRNKFDPNLFFRNIFHDFFRILPSIDFIIVFSQKSASLFSFRGLHTFAILSAALQSQKDPTHWQKREENNF